MHLLYLDESGNEKGANDWHFVLAALAVHEACTAPLAQAVDALQERLFPNHPPVHFHANEIRAGKNFWRRVREELRDEALATDSALRGRANVLLTPHMAFYSEDSLVEVQRTVAEDVARVLSGETPRHRAA